ncbi:CopG family transcriptional regulator [Pseudomonas poae]|uniref:CopG family transcriptional regulator n=1 Tax=Pseudomonas poae TaxID=200451 RepID=UPI003B21FE2A
MTGISLNLPEAMDVLRDYIEHEQALTAQIELAVKEADQGNFATDDHVAAMRARRIAVAQRVHPIHRNRRDAAQGLESS